LEQPRVSAICITDHRVDFLRRSIWCFFQQKYSNKELIVVVPQHDEETLQYLESLGSPEITIIPIDASDPITLGEKRNLAVQMSTGFYFCTWDDDDWYHANRIAHQVAHAQQTGKRSSAISNVLVYDTQEQQAYLSFHRPWEQTLLCERSIVTGGIGYGNLNKGEDSVLVAALRENGWIDSFFEPFLYIYCYHGGNTWHREHWKQNIFQPGKTLSKEFSGGVAAILQSETDSDSITLETLWKKLYP
jgi:glycosyltransferase involved in cell wall biosynthesis